MTYIAPNPNGTAPVTASAPIVLAAKHVAGTARTTPAVNYEFLTNSTNGWFDTLGYAWVSYTILAGAGVPSGTIVFEQTNDTTNAAAGVPMQLQNENTLGVQRVTSTSLFGNSIYQLSGPITARYIRARVSVVVPSGTVTLSYTLKQSAPPLTYQVGNVTSINDPSATLGKVNLGTGSNFAGLLRPTLQSPVSDLNTTVSGLVVSGTYYLTSSAAASMAVTVSTGTGALDVIIQETSDNINFVDVYHFDRITGAGTYYSPPLQLNGTGFRYWCTCSGSMPVVTSHTPCPTGYTQRVYYDRNMAFGSAGYYGGPFLAYGGTQYTMVINTTSAASMSSVDLQISPDGTNWQQVGILNTAIGTNAVAQATFSGFTAKWVRAYPTSYGSITLNYLQMVVSQ